MNYKNEDLTKRAEESNLWEDLEKQDGLTLPYLLERYLLLENWNQEKFKEESAPGIPSTCYYEVQFLHLLLANATTVLLSQEERIRNLESKLFKKDPTPPEVRVMYQG